MKPSSIGKLAYLILLFGISVCLPVHVLLASTSVAHGNLDGVYAVGLAENPGKSLATGRAATCTNSTLGLTISPCNPSTTTPAGQNGSKGFLITNSSNTSRSLNISVTCSGAVSNCSASPNPVFVHFGDDGSFTVTWTASINGGTGTVTVTVGGMTSVITVTVPVPPSDFALDTTTTNLTDQF